MKKYSSILLILGLLSLTGNIKAEKTIDDKSLIKQGIELYDKNTKEDDKKAFSIFYEAAKSGNVRAAEQVYSMVLSSRGIELKSDHNWLKELAELGSGTAQHDMARAYQRGVGVEKDLAKAAELFLKSAKKGHAHAQYDISNIYYFGQEVKPNREQAIFWAKKAAAHNIALAHLNLGRWLSKSKLPAEVSESDKWFKSAEPLLRANAKKGDHYSGFWRAMMYEGGLGVKKDIHFAFGLYQDLAELGDRRSQFSLSRMYWEGSGVKQDKMESRRWLKASAENGYPLAQKTLKKLER